MSGPPRESVVRATWWALLTPRRLVPIIVVSAPLIFAQGHFSRDPFAWVIAVLMCVLFIGLAPVSYRVLFPDGLDLSHGAVRLVLYAAIGAGAVLSVGVAIPRLTDMGHSFLGDRWSLTICTALFLVGGWGLGRDIGFEQRVARLQKAADEAQLLAVRSHLDPHFLFNSLNAIAEWCRQDGEVAEAAILKLSQMLRVVLAGVKETRWPLSQELDLVRTLFSLHLLRDRELFRLDESLAEPLPDVLVPPMALLTLAENAVKHGPGIGHRGVIALHARPLEGGVELTLENPGPYKGERPGSDGLPMLKKRLQLAYDGRATVSVGPAADPSRTLARVWIPTT